VSALGNPGMDLKSSHIKVCERTIDNTPGYMPLASRLCFGHFWARKWLNTLVHIILWEKIQMLI